MAEPLFIGVDLGTARVKVGIFDRRGTQLALQILPHSSLLGPHVGVTQDADAWWQAVCHGIRETVAVIDPARIVAISVCGQGPSLVATDAELRPRGHALTWMDHRATAEAAQLSGRLGRQVDSGRLAAKALRLSLQEPDPTRRWFLQAWDYIAARLCGVPMTSSAWDEAELSATGLPRNQFPPYIAAGAAIGPVTENNARLLGLPSSVVVVAGTNDSIASCIGSAATLKGRSVILGGTSGGFVVCWDRVPGVWTPPPNTYPEPDGCTYLGFTISSSGLLIDWLASLGGVADYVDWIEQAAQVPIGADRLTLLPYIAGIYLPYAGDERAPVNDPNARGVLFGMSLRHTTAHLIRAALEGIAYAIRQVHEVTVVQGGITTESVSVGGQAHSTLWNQIKANVLGLPVLIPAVVEAGALGAACLAATGSGYFATLWEASEAMVHMATRLEPDNSAHQTYSELYAGVYAELYPRLQDLFSRQPLTTATKEADLQSR